MRKVVVVAVLSLALAACGGSDGQGGAAPSSAPPSAPPSATKPAQSDLARVRAAVKATRAKKTATFVVKGTTGIQGGGTVEMRRDGKYDLGASRASIVQTMSANPPDLLSQIVGEEVDADDLESRSVLAGKVSYLQMPAWPAPAHAKWLRFSAADIAKATDVAADVESSIFPAAVEMLAEAEASARDGKDAPAMAHVVVPASVAFVAFPSSTTRKLIQAGVDPEKITGEIEVDVSLQDGLVTGVWFDALPAFKKAYEQIGQPRVANALTELSTVVDLQAHGQRVTIPVPPAKEVMTEAEFASYSR